jgi:flagellar biosynthetic protein FliO
VSGQKKKVAGLFVVLLVGGGWVGLTARSTGEEKANAPAPRADVSFLADPSLSNPAGVGLGSRELFAKMMLSVALVAALAIAAFYVSKKVLPKVTNAPDKEIRVVETAYLGPRKTLHVVQVGNQRLLIGSTNETITTLAHLSDAWLDPSKQETENAVVNL